MPELSYTNRDARYLDANKSGCKRVREFVKNHTPNLDDEKRQRESYNDPLLFRRFTTMEAITNM